MRTIRTENTNNTFQLQKLERSWEMTSSPLNYKIPRQGVQRPALCLQLWWCQLLLHLGNQHCKQKGRR